MDIKTTDIAVLGAGIAGLGAALKARELGREAVLYEARASAGGLLDNFSIDGFRFDRAVHLSFATEPKVREIFDATPSITHPSDSYCFEESRWLKHPVQNNLYPLPPAERQALIQSYINRPAEAGTTYEDWLRHQYGDAIAERFPIKYTQKYWATPAASMSTTWIGNRMRRSEVGEVLFGAFTSDTPNTYYTKEMRYPKTGGYKAFIEPLIAASRIELDHAAVRIDIAAKQVQFIDGTAVGYNELVSTLALPRLIALIDDAPAPVVAAAAGLKATSIDLISVGIRTNVVKDLWFYIYDDDILASRAYSPSVKSPENAPVGTSSLQFEIYSRGEKSRFSADELKKNTLYALEKMGICTEKDVLFTDHRFLEFGNVVFDLGMEEKRAVVLDWLKEIGISSCGRFGEWDYLWSNQSLLSGYNAVRG
jgi:protoporphyrinogen oxidase